MKRVLLMCLVFLNAGCGSKLFPEACFYRMKVSDADFRKGNVSALLDEVLDRKFDEFNQGIVEWPPLGVNGQVVFQDVCGQLGYYPDLEAKISKEGAQILIRPITRKEYISVYETYSESSVFPLPEE